MGTKYLLSRNYLGARGTDILATALLSNLPRRADQSCVTTVTAVPVIENHPAFAFLCRVFLGTPVGRYGFPHFGRGNTPLHPNYILRRAPGLQQLYS